MEVTSEEKVGAELVKTPIAYVNEKIEEAGRSKFVIDVDIPAGWTQRVIDSVKRAFVEKKWRVYQIKGPKGRHYLEMHQGIEK